MVADCARGERKTCAAACGACAEIRGRARWRTAGAARARGMGLRGSPDVGVGGDDGFAGGVGELGL